MRYAAATSALPFVAVGVASSFVGVAAAVAVFYVAAGVSSAAAAIGAFVGAVVSAGAVVSVAVVAANCPAAAACSFLVVVVVDAASSFLGAAAIASCIFCSSSPTRFCLSCIYCNLCAANDRCRFAPLVVSLVRLRLSCFLHLLHSSLGCKHHEVFHFPLQPLRDHNDLKVRGCARSLG